jgi:hypothetical protein
MTRGTVVLSQDGPGTIFLKDFLTIFTDTHVSNLGTYDLYNMISITLTVANPGTIKCT